MIYVSSACSRCKRIDNAVTELAEEGFINIELTGGTEYYQSYQQDLLIIKEKFGLNYLLHNYFPPPTADFVINIASLDDHAVKKSISQLCESIKLSTLLSADKFGFHAGFTVEMSTQDLGRTIKDTITWEKNAGLRRFCQTYGELLSYCPLSLQLYIENNVYSYDNYLKFGDLAPFMLLTFEDYLELREHINFDVLLDVAHLYVTCQTLQLSFEEQMASFMEVTDYIHVSDNNGLQDQNCELSKSSPLFRELEKYDLSGKTVTLEIYSGLDTVKESYELIASQMR